MGAWEPIIGLVVLLAIIVAFFAVASRATRRSVGSDGGQMPISNAPLDPSNFGPTSIRFTSPGLAQKLGMR
ncbi:hypothetical protein IP70_16660 [alpha proteobacterium AAP38]|nr:hypothetical protein IP70_16660 [alpha proteobacterium AAP38]